MRARRKVARRPTEDVPCASSWCCRAHLFCLRSMCDAIYTFALSLAFVHTHTHARHIHVHTYTLCTHSMELSLLAGCEIGECAPRSHEVPGRRLQTSQQGRQWALGGELPAGHRLQRHHHGWTRAQGAGWHSYYARRRWVHPLTFYFFVLIKIMLFLCYFLCVTS